MKNSLGQTSENIACVLERRVDIDRAQRVACSIQPKCPYRVTNILPEEISAH